MVSAAMVFLTISFSGCDKDSDKGPVGGNTVEWNPEMTVHPNQEGATALNLSAAEKTNWSAKINSESNWVSFQLNTQVKETQGVVGSSISSRTLYVYYQANNTNAERQATIEFTYEGQAPVEMVLTQYSTTSGGDVYESGQADVWPEIPTQKINGNYIYVSHFATLTIPGTKKSYNARNYTMCFDKTKRAAWWVAYPLHSIYTSSGRKDTWAYDPKIAADYQANLKKSYTGSSWDRGHQIPNADRNGNPVTMAQTFYYSNMTPQNSQLNQQPWARLEAKARDSWMCSDTLYVVTGAYWNPNSTNATTDMDGNKCPIPDYYFKVFVRTVKGNVRQAGDKLGDYPADQLKSIGFWVANKNGQGEAKQWVKSVKEIETQTGFEFFPSVPASVKEQLDASSWGL